MHGMTRLQRSGAMIWLLLVAALCMRALTPAGYMAERVDGEIVVDICNSDATWRIPLRQRDDGKGDQRHEAPCAFAGIASPATPAADVRLPLVFRDAGAVRPRLAGRVPDSASPRILPPARGPPVPA